MANTGAKSVSVPFLAESKLLASKSDEFIERLAKLIRTTSGLGSLLSTVTYSLYIAAYIDNNAPSRAEIIAAISNLIGRTPKITPTTLKAPPTSPPISRFAPYIGLLNDTRFSIRLTGLVPMYMLLKSILKNPPKDKILRILSKVQIVCYLAFTALENLWFLSSKNLASPTLVNSLGGQFSLLIWSCRPWLVAILCDYARLAREVQIAEEQKARGEKQVSAAEQKAIDKKWYGELFAATSYLPMAIHYSLTSGIGMNPGMIGVSGFLGGGATLLKLWAATKE